MKKREREGLRCGEEAGVRCHPERCVRLNGCTIECTHSYITVPCTSDVVLDRWESGVEGGGGREGIVSDGESGG